MRHQRVVRPLLDDVSVLHDKDEVGVLDGTETMGDDEACPSFGQLVHRFLDLLLGSRVDVAGRLVEDKKRRVLDHRPGNGEELLLSAGDGAGILDHMIQATWERADVMPHGSLMEGIVDFLVGNAFGVVDEVLADGPLEHPRILKDHAEDVVDFLAGHVLDGNAVDEDIAAVDLVEAHEEVDHGRLSGAGRSDDGDLHARLDLGREVVDDLARVVIGEADMAEFDLAADVLLSVLVAEDELLPFFRDKLVLAEEVEDALGAGGSHLQGIHGLGKLAKRRLEEGDIDGEGRDRAEGDARPGIHQEAADKIDGRIGEVGDEGHERLEETAEALGLEHGRLQLPVFLLEGGVGLLLGIEALDDELAVVGFLDDGVDVGKGILAVLELRHGELRDDDDEDDHEGEGDKGGQGHLPGRAEHRDEDANEHEEGLDDHADAGLEGLANLVDVVGERGEDVTVLMAIEVGERNLVDLLGDVLSQLHRIEVGRRGEDVVGAIGGQGDDKVEDDKDDADVEKLLHVDRLREIVVGDLVGEVGKIARGKDLEDDADDKKEGGDANRNEVLSGILAELLEGSGEIALFKLGRTLCWILSHRPSSSFESWLRAMSR